VKYRTSPEFDKDLKRLLKSYTSLREDLEIMSKFLLEVYFENGVQVPLNALVKIEGFCKGDILSYKIRKFACTSLKSKGCMSGIRVIIVYYKNKNEILFVEIY
jgi:mRNA-degrading endonuclease RelE of RelBE toxin-antitoxin system